MLDAAAEARSWGHAEGSSLILKCDSESTCGREASQRGAKEAGMTVREIMKVYKCQLEGHIGKVEDTAVIMQWMAR